MKKRLVPICVKPIFLAVLSIDPSITNSSMFSINSGIVNKNSCLSTFHKQFFAGNVAQGAVVNGTYDGQGLHFRWGDGSIFKCEELSICFLNNTLVRVNGTYALIALHNIGTMPRYLIMQ